MEAAVAASRANKRAGELLFRERGYAYCASDLAEKLPEAMKWR
jgi:NAD(P)H-hydrate repair Nnr-like enzyme with NAD(P)H-hydrate dehydratase domain